MPAFCSVYVRLLLLLFQAGQHPMEIIDAWSGEMQGAVVEAIMG